MVSVSLVAQNIGTTQARLMERLAESGIHVEQGKYGTPLIRDRDAEMIAEEVREWFEDLWSVEEAADLLKISMPSVKKLKDEGLLKGKRCRWIYTHFDRYTQEELSELIYRFEHAIGGFENGPRPRNIVSEAVKCRFDFPGVEEWERMKERKKGK